jgi:hypothetical protein
VYDRQGMAERKSWSGIRSGFRSFFTYYSRFWARVLVDFLASAREQVIVGLLIALLILVYQFSQGKFATRAQAKSNFLEIAWPYAVMLLLYVCYHVVRAPWLVDVDGEEHKLFLGELIGKTVAANDKLKEQIRELEEKRPWIKLGHREFEDFDDEVGEEFTHHKLTFRNVGDEAALDIWVLPPSLPLEVGSILLPSRISSLTPNDPPEERSIWWGDKLARTRGVLGLGPTVPLCVAMAVNYQDTKARHWTNTYAVTYSANHEVAVDIVPESADTTAWWTNITPLAAKKQKV